MDRSFGELERGGTLEALKDVEFRAEAAISGGGAAATAGL